MPLVIFDGPEAAGKSTIIDALEAEWGGKSSVRHWGPRESWLEYCKPLFDDLKYCQSHPLWLIIWSRSWASRTVYNNLLAQGQIVPTPVTKELENIVLRAGGLLYLVTAPVSVLQERRLTRIAEGGKPDHQLDVNRELHAFQGYIRQRKWKNLSGTADVETNVRSIVHDLVQRNPECRMYTRSEEPIASATG